MVGKIKGMRIGIISALLLLSACSSVSPQTSALEGDPKLVYAHLYADLDRGIYKHPVFDWRVQTR